jgi:hypothetical protein
MSNLKKYSAMNSVKETFLWVIYMTIMAAAIYGAMTFA